MTSLTAYGGSIFKKFTDKTVNSDEKKRIGINILNIFKRDIYFMLYLNKFYNRVKINNKGEFVVINNDEIDTGRTDAGGAGAGGAGTSGEDNNILWTKKFIIENILSLLTDNENARRSLIIILKHPNNLHTNYTMYYKLPITLSDHLQLPVDIFNTDDISDYPQVFYRYNEKYFGNASNNINLINYLVCLKYIYVADYFGKKLTYGNILMDLFSSENKLQFFYNVIKLYTMCISLYPLNSYDHYLYPHETSCLISDINNKLRISFFIFFKLHHRFAYYSKIHVYNITINDDNTLNYTINIIGISPNIKYTDSTILAATHLGADLAPWRNEYLNKDIPKYHDIIIHRLKQNEKKYIYFFNRLKEIQLKHKLEYKFENNKYLPSSPVSNYDPRFSSFWKANPNYYKSIKHKHHNVYKTLQNLGITNMEILSRGGRRYKTRKNNKKRNNKSKIE